MSIDIDFLNKALQNEKAALSNAQAAYYHFRDSGNEKMAAALKEIMQDEARHVVMITQLLKKKTEEE